MAKTLSTTEAEQDAQKMLNIINELPGLINQLTATGNTMSDPNRWDGRYAAQFRQDWPQASASLRRMHTDLVNLQHSVATVLKDIITAGGGAN